MNEDNKRNTTLWLRPSTIQRMDSWLAEDNCQSRSEFVEKALRFYMGYLGTEDNTAYISKAILTAIQGTLDDNNILTDAELEALPLAIPDAPLDAGQPPLVSLTLHNCSSVSTIVEIACL